MGISAVSPANMAKPKLTQQTRTQSTNQSLAQPCAYEVWRWWRREEEERLFRGVCAPLSVSEVGEQQDERGRVRGSKGVTLYRAT